MKNCFIHVVNQRPRKSRRSRLLGIENMSIQKIDRDKIEIDVTVCTATVQTLSLLVRYILDGSSFFTTDYQRNTLTRFIPTIRYWYLVSK